MIPCRCGESALLSVRLKVLVNYPWRITTLITNRYQRPKRQQITIGALHQIPTKPPNLQHDKNLGNIKIIIKNIEKLLMGQRPRKNIPMANPGASARLGGGLAPWSPKAPPWRLPAPPPRYLHGSTVWGAGYFHALPCAGLFELPCVSVRPPCFRRIRNNGFLTKRLPCTSVRSDPGTSMHFHARTRGDPPQGPP